MSTSTHHHTGSNTGFDAAAAPAFPRITAHFEADDTVTVTLLGVARTFTHSPDTPPPRIQALQYVHQVAASEDFGRPVRVHTTTPAGASVQLVVTPEGTFFDAADPTDVHALAEEHQPRTMDSQEDQAPSLLDRLTGPDQDDPAPAVGGHRPPTVSPETSASTPVPPPGGVDADPSTRAPDQDPEHGVVTEAAQHRSRRRTAAATPAPTGPVQAPAGAAPAPERPGRHSFIRTEIAVQPATQGWRGWANRLGMRLDPGPEEVAFRDDVGAVSVHWPGPRTVAIANGKGSANKTPTTVMLAAVFARYGGAGVLAWDNNETRGSLAWRTQRATHDATVLDLLPRVDQLLATTAQSAEMSHFTHHQPADKYDVLHSDQSVEGDHEVTAEDVEQLHRVAGRYYRMILMDSGNNERAANWRSMICRANALVMPCTNVEDTPEAGALMLDALTSRDEHSAELAANAVAIVSQRTPGKDTNMARIVEGLTPLVREVVTIPYDPALVSGVIHFDAMRSSTQRAWLRAAAAVARSL